MQSVKFDDLCTNFKHHEDLDDSGGYVTMTVQDDGTVSGMVYNAGSGAGLMPLTVPTASASSVRKPRKRGKRVLYAASLVLAREAKEPNYYPDQSTLHMRIVLVSTFLRSSSAARRKTRSKVQSASSRRYVAASKLALLLFFPTMYSDDERWPRRLLEAKGSH